MGGGREVLNIIDSKVLSFKLNFRGKLSAPFLFKPEPAHLLCPAVGTWNEMCKSFLNKKPKWTNKLWHALKYVDLCSLTEKSKAWVVGILHCTAVITAHWAAFQQNPAQCSMSCVHCSICVHCAFAMFLNNICDLRCAKHTVHCSISVQHVVLYYQWRWDGWMGVQMWKAPRSNQEWCLSLKLGDTDLRAAALQEMKHNNTMLQIGKKKKSSVEKG